MSRKNYIVFALVITAAGVPGFFVPAIQRVAVLLSLAMLLALWARLITGRVRSWRARGCRAQVQDALAAFAEDTGSTAFGVNDARFVSWLFRSSEEHWQLKENMRNIRREWSSLAKALIGTLAIFVIVTTALDLLRDRLL